jgi:hypothetical protein
MDRLKSIATKLDIREFSERKVPEEVVADLLGPARLTGSGINKQRCPQGR